MAEVGEISADTTTIHIGVSRLGCAGGETGTVLQPEVMYEHDSIVIRTSVVSLPADGAYTCPGNDFVPITIRLSEPVGSRPLIDAACLDGPAATTAWCVDDGVRWRP